MGLARRMPSPPRGQPAPGMALAPVCLWLLLAGCAGLFDPEAPRVLRVAPQDGSSQAVPGDRVTVVFSRPMNRDKAEKAFALTGGGVRVQGDFSWDGETLVFTPWLPLKTGVRRALWGVSPALAERLFTVHYACLARRR